MLTLPRKIFFCAIIMLIVGAFCMYATAADKFQLTYHIPKGFEVKSITLVFMPAEQLYVVAVNKTTGETLLLVYEPKNAEPVSTVKFKEQ
jgi:Na+-transporting methylmalonyl-CoA/oxaloacetate decarboxylase beta subunit